MDDFRELLKLMAKPTIALFFIVFVLIFVRGLLDRHLGSGKHHRLHRRMIMGTVLLFCLLVFVFSLPNQQNLRGQVVGLIGILLSGAIALSSTTFLGNALAGIMLRSVKSFRPGDFISVNGFRGRVSARGLFHIEIQSADRDLTTLPNLFLATNPVKVTNSSGTIIKAEVSLGYDESRRKIEALLLEAAERTDLVEPFVQIVELGDFSVLYRINGLLTDSSKFLTSESKLNAMVLDTLHEADVEIVSPNFMNTRNVTNQKFLHNAEPTPEEVRMDRNQVAPEKLIFDKAMQAELVEEQKGQIAELTTECEKLKEQIKSLSDKGEKAALRDLLKIREKRILKLKRRVDRMSERIEESK
jgi:small-conductance mechanosensitive channel